MEEDVVDELEIQVVMWVMEKLVPMFWRGRGELPMVWRGRGEVPVVWQEEFLPVFWLLEVSVLVWMV